MSQGAVRMQFTHTVGVVVPSSTVDMATLSPSISAARLLLSMFSLSSVPAIAIEIFVGAEQNNNQVLHSKQPAQLLQLTRVPPIDVREVCCIFENLQEGCKVQMRHQSE